jgi:hypothetical protein
MSPCFGRGAAPTMLSVRGYAEDWSFADVDERPDVSRPGPTPGEGLLDLQRTAGNQATTQFLAEEPASPVLDVIGRGGGSPLDGALRGHMESRLGHDFGDVRLHTNGPASESAAAVGAHAYTVGNEIVFGSGHYDPSSPAGQKTIAHELTHVVQQRVGPVAGEPAPGGIQISDPGDRFEQEAETTAEQAMPSLAAPGVGEVESHT